jgi:hypothetical protein
VHKEEDKSVAIVVVVSRQGGGISEDVDMLAIREETRSPLSLPVELCMQI